MDEEERVFTGIVEELGRVVEVTVADDSARIVVAGSMQQHDKLGGAVGTFQTTLTNTATFGTVTKTASVRLRGSIPGVTGKQVDPWADLVTLFGTITGRSDEATKIIDSVNGTGQYL